MKRFSFLSVFTFCLLGIQTPAFAYVGLGPAMTMIGSFFSLILGVLVVLAMVLYLPIRIMLKRRKNKLSAPSAGASSENPPPDA